MRLHLTRPLVFFDLEATGISTIHDRIVQISAAKHRPDGQIEVKTRLINPEMPIPPSSTEIHGITDDDVRDAPTFRQIARSLATFFDDCDLAGFNIIQFDIPLLINEFQRVGKPLSMTGRRIVDAYQIFRRQEPRTLEAALRYYCQEEHPNAHDSEADVLATIKVLEGQFHKYPDLPHDVETLDRDYNPRSGKYIDWEGKLRWENGEVILGFGKRIGTRLRDLAQDDPGFLEWILRADFSAEVKQIVADAIDGRYPEPPPAPPDTPPAAEPGEGADTPAP